MNKEQLLRDLRFDEYEFGIHSNIPDCCVRSFVAGRTGSVFSHEEHMALYYKGCNYVPCRECMKEILAGSKKPNELHKCKLGDSALCDKYINIQQKWTQKNKDGK